MAVFNAAEFRSRLQFAGARPNSYRVTILFPVGGGASSSAAVTEEFSFMCRATQAPGMTIGTILVPYMGRYTKYAGDRTFEDWSCTVFLDEDMQINSAFERWQNRLNAIDHDTNRVENLSGLKGAGGSISMSRAYARARVDLIGKEGNVIRSYTLHNVFPSILEPVQLAYDANDVIMERGAVFAYDYFTTNDISGLQG